MKYKKGFKMTIIKHLKWILISIYIQRKDIKYDTEILNNKTIFLQHFIKWIMLQAVILALWPEKVEFLVEHPVGKVHFQTGDPKFTHSSSLFQEKQLSFSSK